MASVTFDFFFDHYAVIIYVGNCTQVTRSADDYRIYTSSVLARNGGYNVIRIVAF